MKMRGNDMAFWTHCTAPGCIFHLVPTRRVSATPTPSSFPTHHPLRFAKNVVGVNHVNRDANVGGRRNLPRNGLFNVGPQLVDGCRVVGPLVQLHNVQKKHGGHAGPGQGKGKTRGAVSRGPPRFRAGLHGQNILAHHTPRRVIIGGHGLHAAAAKLLLDHPVGLLPGSPCLELAFGNFGKERDVGNMTLAVIVDLP